MYGRKRCSDNPNSPRSARAKQSGWQGRTRAACEAESPDIIEFTVEHERTRVEEGCHQSCAATNRRAADSSSSNIAATGSSSAMAVRVAAQDLRTGCAPLTRRTATQDRSRVREQGRESNTKPGSHKGLSRRVLVSFQAVGRLKPACLQATLTTWRQYPGQELMPTHLSSAKSAEVDHAAGCQRVPAGSTTRNGIRQQVAPVKPVRGQTVWWLSDNHGHLDRPSPQLG